MSKKQDKLRLQAQKYRNERLRKENGALILVATMAVGAVLLLFWLFVARNIPRTVEHIDIQKNWIKTEAEVIATGEYTEARIRKHSRMSYGIFYFDKVDIFLEYTLDGVEYRNYYEDLEVEYQDKNPRRGESIYIYVNPEDANEIRVCSTVDCTWDKWIEDIVMFGIVFVIIAIKEKIKKRKNAGA